MNNVWVVIKRWFETSTKKQKWTAALTVLGLCCTVALMSINGGSEPARDPLGSTPLYFAGAFIKLLVVLLLIFVSAIFVRRWAQPGLHGKANRQMRVVETVRLSPKQALHLVSIGDQQVLIGATDQNVALLAHMDGIVDSPSPELTNSQPGLDFGSVLQSFNIHLPGGSSK